MDSLGGTAATNILFEYLFHNADASIFFMEPKFPIFELSLYSLIMSNSINNDHVREEVWKFLISSKFKWFYFNRLILKFHNRDRAINIFLTLTSAGSIGGWSIWSTIPYVWATLLALAQVTSIMRQFFPFARNKKEIIASKKSLSANIQKLEELWIEIELEGILDQTNGATEVLSRLKVLMKDVSQSLTFEDDVVFREYKKLVKAAQVDLANYAKHK